jgi:hypothetical protein
MQIADQSVPWKIANGVENLVLQAEVEVGFTARYYFLSECCCLKFVVLFLWSALSDERAGLQFNHSMV